MATDLATLLGNELKVGLRPRNMQRTFRGYAGANGVSAMNLGGRGYVVPILGTIRVSGENYDQARSNAITASVGIENLQVLEPGAYSYKGEVFGWCIFANYRLLASAGGKTFVYNSEGKMIVRFAIDMISLM